MTKKDEPKTAQKDDSSCPAGCSGDNKVWLVALLGFLVGLLVMYLAMPALFPPEVTVVEVTPPTEAAPATAATTFKFNEAKVAEITSVLEDTYLLNTGEEIPVTYVSYETQGTHGVLYYEVMGQQMPIYVSMDYQYLYPSAINLEQMESEIAAAKEAYLASLSAAPVEPVVTPTSAEPEVQLFIMSNCPYGNQAENGIVSVVSLLDDEVAFEPVYIIYDESIHPAYSAESGECLVDAQNVTYCSMHGLYELEQGVREKVIYNIYGEAVWAEYVTGVNNDCYALGQDIETCWKDVAYEMGLDTTLIEETYATDLYTILAREKQLTFATENFGSPSLVINGVKYSGSRTAEDYKAAICAAFDTEPEDCVVTLSSTEEASAGSCG